MINDDEFNERAGFVLSFGQVFALGYSEETTWHCIVIGESQGSQFMFISNKDLKSSDASPKLIRTKTLECANLDIQEPICMELIARSGPWTGNFMTLCPHESSSGWIGHSKRLSCDILAVPDLIKAWMCGDF